MTSAPKQHPAREIDEVVLHEVFPFSEAERPEGLTKDALRLRDPPLHVAAPRHLVEKVRETDVKRGHFVGFIGVLRYPHEMERDPGEK